MDNQDYQDHFTDQYQQMQYPVHPPLSLENQVQLLHTALRANEQKVAHQDAVIADLANFNRHMHAKMTQLENRLIQVETDNSTLRGALEKRYVPAGRHAAFPLALGEAGDRSQSPSPTRERYRDREDKAFGGNRLQQAVTSSPKKNKGRNQLQIDIPGNIHAPTMGVGFPTPITNPALDFQLSTPITPFREPNTPITPDRIGPSDMTKKSATLVFKRTNHNLDKICPPATVQIPLIPLTDTEVIVYFYQSTSRPIVALRLYARNWGPATIVEILNQHREITPTYLANTCSVKCTTAIKKGRALFGENWEEVYRGAFKEASDVLATEMIRFDKDELEEATDYEVRALSVGLKKYPEADVDGGIFTTCVKYCQDNNAAYTLGNVWQLAKDLEEGRIPQGPSSVSPGI